MNDLHLDNPSGIAAIMIAFIFVFLALLLLYFLFKVIGHIMTIDARKAAKLKEASSSGLVEEKLSGEVNAAIVMALYLYGSELHDQEDPVITMTKVSRTYSPWSSKIYGLRKSPR
jgi:Na+-transporting methylmalonyl-CoA/oxaloacetate decarboxylase gamma subunit